MAAPPPKKAGMTLYGNLLSPQNSDSNSATISGAPVKYDAQKLSAAEEEAEKKKKDASLKFQPIKRPQVQQKSKPRVLSSSTGPKVPSSTASSVPSASSPDKQTPPAQPPQQPAQRSNFEDWVGDADEDEYFLGLQERPRHERGGKRGRRKKRRLEKDTHTWDWDDIYDPTVPNQYADYKGSEEEFREMQEWRDRLHYDPTSNTIRASKDSEGDQSRSRSRSHMPSAFAAATAAAADISKLSFAPPAALSFAPPTFYDTPKPSTTAQDDEDDYYAPMPASSDRSHKPPLSFAPPTIYDDATGEDAYARRMRATAQMSSPPAGSPQSAPTIISPPPPTNAVPSIHMNKAAADIAAKKAEIQAKLAAAKAKIASETNPPASAAPVHSVPSPPPPPPPEPAESGVISKGPVRYSAPPPVNVPAEQDMDAGTDIQTTQDSIPQSSLPGRPGFAERYMQKLGYEKGKGLGAEGNEGITTALKVKSEKGKAIGKIVGGKRTNN